MTDRELIEAVATRHGWEGWEYLEYRDRVWWVRMPACSILRELPSWLTSRDAAHEVVATVDRIEEYVIALDEIILPTIKEPISHVEYIWAIHNATARQRIEAFVKVVGEGNG